MGERQPSGFRPERAELMREEHIWLEASGLGWGGKFCRRLEREREKISAVVERQTKGHRSGSEARNSWELIFVCCGVVYAWEASLGVL